MQGSHWGECGFFFCFLCVCVFVHQAFFASFFIPVWVWLHGDKFAEGNFVFMSSWCEATIEAVNCGRAYNGRCVTERV